MVPKTDVLKAQKSPYKIGPNKFEDLLERDPNPVDKILGADLMMSYLEFKSNIF